MAQQKEQPKERTIDDEILESVTGALDRVEAIENQLGPALHAMLDRVEAIENQLGPALHAIARVLEREIEYDGRTLDERIAAVQLELEDVPRRGHAEIATKSGGTYTYDYITEADLMSGVRPLLAKHGVAVYYSDKILELTGGMARVEATLVFRANGEQIVCSGEGVGTDTGDKAANKAKTSAVRYVLWKMFLQPSDEDPEQENVSQDEAARAHASRSSTASSSRRSGPSREGLRSRISQLAVELDEVQGHPAGRTLGSLDELVKQTYDGNGLDAVTDAQLVEVGQAIGLFVTSERQRRETEGESYVAHELTLGG